MGIRGAVAVTVVAVIGLWLAGGRARAQALPPSYAVVKAELGLTGWLSGGTEAVTLQRGSRTISLPATDADSGLATSFGAAVGYMFSVERYVALGSQISFHVWRSSAGADTGAGYSAGFDLAFVPQGRLPINPRLELYLSLPIALTLSTLDEYKTWTERQLSARGTAQDVDPAFGYGLGLSLGTRFALTDAIGVLLEFGYQRYAFTHSVEFRILRTLERNGSGATLGLDLVTQQLLVRAGVFL